MFESRDFWRENRIICPEVAVNGQFLPGRSKVVLNCLRKSKFFGNLPGKSNLLSPGSTTPKISNQIGAAGTNCTYYYVLCLYGCFYVVEYTTRILCRLGTCMWILCSFLRHALLNKDCRQRLSNAVVFCLRSRACPVFFDLNKDSINATAKGGKKLNNSLVGVCKSKLVFILFNVQNICIKQ